MIGFGMDRFDPVLPEDATIGRLSPTEAVSRQIRDIMIGLEYQEMMYNYLVSKDNIVDKMNINDESVVEIANPMSRSYGMVRNSIIPNLLQSEAVSAHALYPHKIFEIGCVVQKEFGKVLTTSTKHYLGMLMADTAAGFNEINAHLSAVLYYMNLKCTLKPVYDPRFIDGRCAALMMNNHPYGILGEIHPEVLENWHIEMPCSAAEMDISIFNQMVS
jgi:phenylalanyl-tRNA synthetase beta chain